MIDLTKPIKYKTGGNAVVLEWKDNETAVVAFYGVDNDTYSFRIGTAEKLSAKFCNIPDTTDTPTAQPEIDWSGEVEWRASYHGLWESVSVCGGPVGGHVWIKRARDQFPNTWKLEPHLFRNKPAEPKLAQAIVKMFRSPSHDIVLRGYIKTGDTTVDSVRRCHPPHHGTLLDVIELDLHSVEGLESNNE